ncbi:hypothetical protein B0J14DRAFT_558532 [Halenospora varia]|nr:hypothetical protein B0J14DRAFT_558532 [Halenospora varia]
MSSQQMTMLFHYPRFMLALYKSFCGEESQHTNPHQSPVQSGILMSQTIPPPKNTRKKKKKCAICQNRLGDGADEKGEFLLRNHNTCPMCRQNLKVDQLILSERFVGRAKPWWLIQLQNTSCLDEWWQRKLKGQHVLSDLDDTNSSTTTGSNAEDDGNTYDATDNILEEGSEGSGEPHNENEAEDDDNSGDCHDDEI